MAIRWLAWSKAKGMICFYQAATSARAFESRGKGRITSPALSCVERRARSDAPYRSKGRKRFLASGAAVFENQRPVLRSAPRRRKTLASEEAVFENQRKAPKANEQNRNSW
jgi:hypothetical protein